MGVESQYGQYGRHDRPLVVDPDARSVEVLNPPLRGAIDRNYATATPEAVYLAGNGYFVDGKRCLFSICPPDFIAELLVSDIPEGRLVAYDGRLLIFGSKCWQVDPAAEPGEQVHVLADTVPWTYPDRLVYEFEATAKAPDDDNELKLWRLQMLCQSNHYGLLAVRYHLRYASELFRVVFDEPQRPRTKGDPVETPPHSAATIR